MPSEDVRWVEGVFELCRVARGLGYKVVVVTNQAGIARGLYTEGEYEALMVWMLEEFVKQGVALDAVYFARFILRGRVSISGSMRIGSRGRGCCGGRLRIWGWSWARR
jgi:histidinol phosphatase-like enzyme